MVGKGKRPRDTNRLAKLIVDLSIGEAQQPDPNEGKSPAAVKRGRAGGLKGGKARANKLTDERKHDIARKAATSRWQRE